MCAKVRGPLSLASKINVLINDLVGVICVCGSVYRDLDRGFSQPPSHVNIMNDLYLNSVMGVSTPSFRKQTVQIVSKYNDTTHEHNHT